MPYELHPWTSEASIDEFESCSSTAERR